MADCLQLILSLTLVYAPILGLIEIVTFPLAVFGYFFWITICNGKYLVAWLWLSSIILGSTKLSWLLHKSYEFSKFVYKQDWKSFQSSKLKNSKYFLSDIHGTCPGSEVAQDKVYWSRLVNSRQTAKELSFTGLSIAWILEMKNECLFRK